LGVHPNPIISSSTINYELPNYGRLSINLVDISGVVIKNLYSGYKPTGKYSLNIGEKVKSITNTGLYFLQFDFNGIKQVEKLIINN
jgi:hypothetical protein